MIARGSWVEVILRAPYVWKEEEEVGKPSYACNLGILNQALS